MCTLLECQANFGQKGPQTELQSRRTAVFFVVALKTARGSPTRRRSAPARFWKALKKTLKKNWHAQNHVFYDAERLDDQKLESMFVKKWQASRAPGHKKVPLTTARYYTHPSPPQTLPLWDSDPNDTDHFVC